MTAPVMPAELAEVERRVIDAARRLERAGQYGIPTRSAVAEFEQARSEQALMRMLVASC